MKFYKIRAILVVYIMKLATKLLFVETPPIISVTALIQKGQKLLFVDLTYMKGLGFPGGFVKEKETLEEALKREVFEETGLTVEKAKYIGSEKSDFKGHSTIAAVYVVEASGELKHSEEGKVIWLEPQEATGKMAYKDAAHTLEKFILNSFIQ